MTMQNNIDIIGRNIGRNMLQPKLQSSARKIDDQWPLRVPIAIAAHDGDRPTDGAQIIHHGWLAHIPKMPDLIRGACKIDNLLRQFVMRIRDDENPKHQCLTKARTQEGKGDSQISVSSVPAFLRDICGSWRILCQALI